MGIILNIVPQPYKQMAAEPTVFPSTGSQTTLHEQRKPEGRR